MCLALYTMRWKLIVLVIATYKIIVQPHVQVCCLQYEHFNPTTTAPPILTNLLVLTSNYFTDNPIFKQFNLFRIWSVLRTLKPRQGMFSREI